MISVSILHTNKFYRKEHFVMFSKNRADAHNSDESHKTIKSLPPRQVADLLGHSTSQITELYYVKKDTARLHGITDGFYL